jgi:hypothetical protein
VGIIFSLLSSVVPVLQAQTEDPWDFLQTFILVRGTVRPIEDGYIAAVLYNSAEEHLALVIFAGICDRSSCAVENIVAHFVIDSRGVLLRHHIQPGAGFESIIGRFQIS